MIKKKNKKNNANKIPNELKNERFTITKLMFLEGKIQKLKSHLLSRYNACS